MALPDRLFVTGTDTGVGKTVVTAALVALPDGAGPAIGLKPLASGVPAGEIGEDAALLGLACGRPETPYRRWEAPVSPHRAALDSGLVAELDEALAWIAARQAPITCVEGVGGWRVPVSPGWGIPELAAALGWPVLIVAANRLGVLNHTLLTAAAVRAAGLPLAGVVLNDAPGPTSADDQGPARARNLEDLRLLTGCPVAPFPALPRLDRPALVAAGAALRRAL
jgi:dethiobiotin synthase